METSGHGHYHNDTAHPTQEPDTVYDDTMLALVRLAAGGVLVGCVLYNCARCVLKRFIASAKVTPEVLIESAPPAYVSEPSAPPPAQEKAPLPTTV